MENPPLLTMAKSRNIDNPPELIQESIVLLETLSGLCSFHSSDDLASFLFTDMFRTLIGTTEPWVAFEIGVYADHAKTIEVIPTVDKITLADASMTGGIPNNVIIAKNQADCALILQNWHDYVMNE